MGRLIDDETLKQELYQQWFMDILLTQKRSDDMFYALAQKNRSAVKILRHYDDV